MSELVVAAKTAPWLLLVVVLGMAENTARPVTSFLIGLAVAFAVSAGLSLAYDVVRQRRREREK